MDRTQEKIGWPTSPFSRSIRIVRVIKESLCGIRYRNTVLFFSSLFLSQKVGCRHLGEDLVVTASQLLEEVIQWIQHWEQWSRHRDLGQDHREDCHWKKKSHDHLSSLTRMCVVRFSPLREKSRRSLNVTIQQAASLSFLT
eukprot:Blabericola_migrator_1__10705@NODE_6116_length_596_cov_4_909263_g4097_i0_p1_GENE_NODE_6116_length_596_cov_4_909263_g4097_i0NODE_6116_length_596_cov_4_909263_g4097_i0_p1_ORF_typecomplete_len141_score22_49_NODE_6116_length_596_cov_4_909263_g4097_i080502